MKFSCDRCQTRYSIGDEKVRGKVLKIRCKTCGNVISVRESTASGAAVAQVAASHVAATGGTSAPASYAPPSHGSGAARGPESMAPTPSGQASAGGIEWFVAIKGKQHGPARFDDVARLVREGKITERTYLWHDQMPAWTRLKEVPEFAALLAEPAARRPAPAPPPPPTEEGAEIVNFEAARQQRMQQMQGVSPALQDPFGAVSGQNLVGGDGAPRDSTRVFIMQAGLANRSQKHRLYATAAVLGGLVLFGSMVLDYQGIIEIPLLHSVVNVVTQKEDAVAAPIPQVAWETGDEDPELKCKLMPNPDECKKQVHEQNAQRRVRRSKPQGAGVSDADLKDAFNTGGPGDDAALKTGTVNPSGFADVSNDAEAKKIAELFKDGRGGPKTPTSRMETPQVSGSNLNAENVTSVVKAGASGVQACVEREAKNGNLPTGKQKLIISVANKGVVENARFADGAVSASPVGECIRQTARKWKFAPFAGDPADIEIPLILSVSM